MSVGFYDQAMVAEIKALPKAVVGWIIVASYAYYIHDESLLSDYKFDAACQWLLENYETINHKFKYLLPKECLIAGSPHHLREFDYPEGFKRIALNLIVDMRKADGQG